LSNNKLTGPIPESIGSLPSLEDLRLNQNELTGTIPKSIGSLINLDRLYLYQNEFTGTIPGSIGSLINLDYLYLNGNKLTGTIPESIGSLVSLKIMKLSNNKLRGTIPRAIGNLPKLEELDLGENKFSTTIPANFGDLISIRRINLSKNALTGTLPDSFRNLTNLEIFRIGNNILTGTIPNIFENFVNLRVLDFSGNIFNGTIPDNIYAAYNIEEINLSKNMLQGYIYPPSVLPRLIELRELILGQNCFFGELPIALVEVMPKLNVLDLSHSNNCVKKRFYTSDCIEKKENILCCGKNEEKLCSKSFTKGDWDSDIIPIGLWGTLPPEYAKFTYLEKLDLSLNSLNGTLPLEFVKFGPQKDVEIKLEGNHGLTGIAALNICRKAQHVFDLTKNETVCPEERTILADIFSKLNLNPDDWVGNGMNIQDEPYCNWKYVTCNRNGRVQEIVINSTSLSGTISRSIGSLTHLEVLNLLDNQIGGTIPKEIGKITNLHKLILAHNRIRGAVPNSIANLSQLEMFQLHGNRLTGTIPVEIGVNMTRYENSSYTSDCGYPTLSGDPLKCKHCTMCCNANEECTTKGKDLYNTYYGISAVVLAPFLLVGLSRIGLFTGLTEPIVAEAVLGKIGIGSVYIFGLSNKWMLNLVAATLVTLQTIIFSCFLYASKFNSVIGSDWRYKWECPINQLSCEKEESGYILLSVLGAICIIIIFIAQDMHGGIWTIIFSNKLRNGVKKFRIFIVGLVLTIVSLFSLYVSVVYVLATTTKITEVIVSSVIILFVNTLDEEVFILLKKIYPTFVQDEIELIKILYADVLENNQNEIQVIHQEEMIVMLRAREEDQEEIRSMRQEIREMRRETREMGREMSEMGIRRTDNLTPSENDDPDIQLLPPPVAIQGHSGIEEAGVVPSSTEMLEGLIARADTLLEDTYIQRVLATARNAGDEEDPNQS